MPNPNDPHDTPRDISAIPLSPWQRMEAIIKHYEFPSVHALARHLGLFDPGILHRIRRDDNGLTREFALTITGKFPQIDMTWLLTRGGGMFSRQAAENK